MPDKHDPPSTESAGKTRLSAGAEARKIAGAGRSAEKARRKARLAEALRANLRRRKGPEAG